MRLVRVAVPVPALDSLTYSVPDEFPMPPIGARVLVPLGSRVMTGCVVETSPGLGTRDSGLGIPQDVRPRQPSKLEDRDSKADRVLLAESRAPSTEPRHAPEIKSLLDILDSTPFLPPDIVKLTTWVSEYYTAGVGEAIAAAMPPRALR